MTSTRSNAVSTSYQNLTLGHLREFQKAGKEKFYTRTSCEHPRRIFIQVPMQSSQDLNARDSWGGFQQDRHTIFSQGPVQDHARTPRGCTRTSRSSHKDLYKIVFLPRKIDKAKTTPSEGRACAVAHGQGTFLCENVQWTSRAPDGVPWSNPGLWHPSVWGNRYHLSTDVTMRSLYYVFKTYPVTWGVQTCSSQLYD